ncbi:flagellar hook-associated protein FlgL [Pelagicoccus mobilis]|uniref:Flagellar hook-associated protein FlgL n=1 Tax=Pelagicoccus mobilis TaxID=415221 RepID=A0A934S0S7_9BACT|nr:flagellar hook-associated protein FlgL [Pelagicoccus mobilis]MBK1878461.1 flagellar hook-associated protein FlgL [Pelagicoccus mobilis]
MRVTTNTFPDNLLSHLQRVTKDMNKLNEQVATGQRISKVSEDSASANRILDMQEEKKRITQFSKNAARAENINNTTISQLQNFIQISDRISELATLADGLKGPDGMKAYAEEVDELIEHAMQSANAKFNGEYIFGGVDTGTEPFEANRDADGKIVVGAGAAVTYEGTAEGAEFHLSETGTIHPYTDGTTNQEFADFINRMVELRDALETGSTDAVTPQMRQDLEESEDELIFALSRQGSVQMRIEFDLTLNKQRFTDLEENISAEADVDIAQTVVRLTQVQNAYQASLKSAGQVLNQSLLDYI